MPEHWSVIIISNPNNLFELNIQDEKDKCNLFYFDSFNIFDERYGMII
jgi:hypothetical protein